MTKVDIALELAATTVLAATRASSTSWLMVENARSSSCQSPYMTTLWSWLEWVDAWADDSCSATSTCWSRKCLIPCHQLYNNFWCTQLKFCTCAKHQTVQECWSRKYLTPCHQLYNDFCCTLLKLCMCANHQTLQQVCWSRKYVIPWHQLYNDLWLTQLKPCTCAKDQTSAAYVAPASRHVFLTSSVCATCWKATMPA